MFKQTGDHSAALSSKQDRQLRIHQYFSGHDQNRTLGHSMYVDDQNCADKLAIWWTWKAYLEFDSPKSMNTVPLPLLDDFSLVTTAPVYQRICSVPHHGRCLGLSELLVPAYYPPPSRFFMPGNKRAGFIDSHFKSRYGVSQSFPSSQLLHSQVLFHHS